MEYSFEVPKMKIYVLQPFAIETILFYAISLSKFKLHEADVGNI